MKKKKKLLVAIPDGSVKATFLPENVCAYAESLFDVTYNQLGRQYTKEELKELLLQQDVVLTGWGNVMLDQSVLKNNEKLKLVVHTGGTVGNLIDSYIFEKKINVFSGNIMYAESVAEGCIAYMLSSLRRIPEYIGAVKNGEWRTEEDLWEGLLDKTIGIVGYGTISKILIEMLHTFRVKIKIYSHYEIEKDFLEKYNCEKASLEDIFSKCDVVSVHSALNKDNHNLIQKRHFELLKDGALFINTSRGAVIDEEALILELKKNRFRAVLDVYMQEPLKAESELRKLSNVYALPHMAGPTLDRRQIISRALLKEAYNFFEGNTNSKFEIDKNLAERMTKM